MRLLLSRLVVVLVLLHGLVATASSSSSSSVNRMPGFMFSRVQGRCTPQYWSSRREEWPRMVPQSSTISKIFGSRVYERYRTDLTLLEATTRNDDHENVFAALLKLGTAALLNSYSRDGYPYPAWEVKTMVIQGMVSKQDASVQVNQFLAANEACT